jgi:hypothetical protein
MGWSVLSHLDCQEEALTMCLPPKQGPNPLYSILPLLTTSKHKQPITP